MKSHHINTELPNLLYRSRWRSTLWQSIYCQDPKCSLLYNWYKARNETEILHYLTISSARSTDLSKFVFKPITEKFVRGQLKQRRTNKAIGLDNTSARLLNDSASVISKSLTKLFSKSLVTLTFPSLWKIEKVSAFFKKGDSCDQNSYRPITVLPTLGKIQEKAVHNQLYYFLNENRIIIFKQFCFRPKLSTNTALTHLIDTLLMNMDSGRLTEAVFLDLSKAFDTVDHNLLLHKV